MEVMRQGNGESEYQSHRHQLPCPPHPQGTPPHPSLPPWSCCRLQQTQGPAWLSWHLVNPEACHPPSPHPRPQKANRSLVLEVPCFPAHFQINSKCQLCCPAHQLGPPTHCHPCLTHTATFTMPCFAAPCGKGASGAFSPLPLPLLMLGLEAESPLLPLSSSIRSGLMTLPERLRLCCLLRWGKLSFFRAT